MFVDISRFLRHSEAVTTRLSRTPDGKLVLLVQPELGKEPEGLGDAERQLRAALAMPLVVRADNPYEFEGLLLVAVARGANARDAVATSYEQSLAALAQKAEDLRQQEEQKKQDAAKKADAKPATGKAAGKAKAAASPTPPLLVTNEPPPAAAPTEDEESPHELPPGPGAPEFRVGNESLELFPGAES